MSLLAAVVASTLFKQADPSPIGLLGPRECYPPRGAISVFWKQLAWLRDTFPGQNEVQELEGASEDSGEGAWTALHEHGGLDIGRSRIVAGPYSQ